MDRYIFLSCIFDITTRQRIVCEHFIVRSAICDGRNLRRYFIYVNLLLRHVYENFYGVDASENFENAVRNRCISLSRESCRTNDIACFFFIEGINLLCTRFFFFFFFLWK